MVRIKNRGLGGGIKELCEEGTKSMRESGGIGRRNKTISAVKVVIALSILLCGCSKKPTITDIENIQSVQLNVKQNYKNVDEDITLPIKELLSELLEAMDVNVVSKGESADAVLKIAIKGKPRKATFKKQKKTFYEAAVVNGTARLAIEGFSAKKVDLYGAKHYRSTTYYPHSNTDPKKPLTFAIKRALVKMIIDLWGPAALSSILQTSGAYALTKEIHDIDEIIEDKDSPAFVPYIFEALESDDSDVGRSAIRILDRFTQTKNYWVKGKREAEVVKMSPEMRNAVLKHLKELTKAVNDDDNRVSITAMYILSRFEEDARVALPAVQEALKGDDDNVQGVALGTLADIARPEESVPFLMDGLKSQSNYVRRVALISIGEIGAGAKQAIPYIIRILNDEKENSNMRNTAAETLEKIGPEAREAVPALIQALKSDNSVLSHSSEDALEAISGQKFGRSVEKWQEWWEGEVKI